MNSYVTLTSPSFVTGTIALWKSLRRFTALSLCAMSFDLSEADTALLSSFGIHVLPIEYVSNPLKGTSSKNIDRFRHTYTKLRAFSLTQFEKIVFLDSDVIVLQPIDDLFDVEGFAAVPDSGRFPNEHRFNSGVFVVRPDAELFDTMLNSVATTPSGDNSDQGFLNVWYDNKWIKLDNSYNTLKRVFYYHPRTATLSKVKVLHFVGTKPWKKRGTVDALRYKTLHRVWQSIMDGP